MIEDDEDLQEEIVFGLKAVGIDARGFGDAATFYRAHAIARCDVAVIDLMLPGEDGLSVIEHLSSTGSVSIVIMTAKGNLQDRVKGLRHGADAYLVKPVHIEELFETINAVQRRSKRKHAAPPEPVHLTPARSGVRLLEGGWVLCDQAGKRMKLTTAERAFLSALFRARGKAVSRDELAVVLGGDPFDFDAHRIDAIVSRLRRKADAEGIQLPLHAVRGTGYLVHS
ncbi:MAG: response regulator transcription factor [Comamonadaceae bacterium]|nr:MAG: response regulator transcription factor [Comamonadaceae bacterium]